MIIVYKAALFLYSISIRIAALFGNEKAKLFINGRINIFNQIQNKLQTNDKRIWVHAASLGEFEQGRPIIEKIKSQYPQCKIVLTFFSPSGYEVRKNYAGADYIFYLPMDTRKNADRFVKMIDPSIVFFIKYEYWFFYLNTLKKKNIPVYLCSAIFRPSQAFFKWYGGWFRQMLGCFNHFFVQTEESKALLESISIRNATVTGDTRFDRVNTIASAARELPEIALFTENRPCLIAGSSWEPDEDLLCKYVNESTGIKFIVAPHEIDEAHTQRIEKLIDKKVVRHSEWKNNAHGDFDVMIIDNIGMLSSLYNYGQVAYIGGGFGKGIHNILEAATFGLPVIFGPNYKKFREAVDLKAKEGAFSISNYEELKQILDKLFTDYVFFNKSATTAKQFVITNIGATDKILSSILFNLTKL
jgi:3-deoxy-D-manno-octulosonic-acid transferase